MQAPRIAYQMAMKPETVELAGTTVYMVLGVFVVGWVPLGHPMTLSGTPHL